MSKKRLGGKYRIVRHVQNDGEVQYWPMELYSSKWFGLVQRWGLFVGGASAAELGEFRELPPIIAFLDKTWGKETMSAKVICE